MTMEAAFDGLHVHEPRRLFPAPIRVPVITPVRLSVITRSMTRCSCKNQASSRDASDTIPLSPLGLPNRRSRGTRGDGSQPATR